MQHAAPLRRSGIARFIKAPPRPDPDPLADVEFEENGAVKRADQAKRNAIMNLL